MDLCDALVERLCESLCDEFGERGQVAEHDNGEVWLELSDGAEVSFSIYFNCGHVLLMDCELVDCRGVCDGFEQFELDLRDPSMFDNMVNKVMMFCKL